ncbi:MAG: hypothetical protein RI922_664 [Bacteroidota bacterium]|jgi:hypothetical protein
METKKDNWMNATLESTEGLRPVALSEQLKSRLKNIPSEITVFEKTIPLSAVWLVAASIALLITVNVVAVRTVKKTKKQQETTIYSDYFSYLEQDL